MESLNIDATASSPLQQARRLLAPRRRREPVWPTLLAATFFAISALGLAAAMLTAPVGGFTPVEEIRSGS